MGSITLLVEGTTVGTKAGGGGVEIVKTVSEQDSARIILALGRMFAVPIDGPAAYRNVLERRFDNFISDVLQEVLNNERQEAARVASEAVTSISVT